jgi:hypothetical protein
MDKEKETVNIKVDFLYDVIINEKRIGNLLENRTLVLNMAHRAAKRGFQDWDVDTLRFVEECLPPENPNNCELLASVTARNLFRKVMRNSYPDKFLLTLDRLNVLKWILPDLYEATIYSDPDDFSRSVFERAIDSVAASTFLSETFVMRLIAFLAPITYMLDHEGKSTPKNRGHYAAEMATTLLLNIYIRHLQIMNGSNILLREITASL